MALWIHAPSRTHEAGARAAKPAAQKASWRVTRACRSPALRAQPKQSDACLAIDSQQRAAFLSSR
ncbi:hypothetical protein Xgly_15960 [Xanthomonas citri pv. glycines]|uniref:Uncharacterized protein n=1 Tax=Xanthomonas campestris pv. glycines TaxID=473421 RepID=A0AAX0HUT0_XANCG|nr:hypothetical protein BHE84_21985 [Xanthomonas citri pv. glycines str. 8ra]ARV21551.1 hypothetical protein A9D66_02750 [Xanthomonas citri pv. glycines str. 12-2]OEY88258.1 hypothetical protein BIY41_02705 [Xanthomonas citri pv. glycines]OOX02413.1 hypothetical protein Xgly_15960 [Xanthomonas citri pv. glycines]QDR43770.1 hypothetical protein FPK90_02860 [Xanthomonas citri pv. glycines]